MKPAIYARVSTVRQETENQLLQMREFAKNRAWPPPVEFVDHETGSSSQRSRFLALFAAAARREIDVVLFWSLDRFSREGAFETLQHLNKLAALGVGFVSYTEPYLDSCGIFKDAIIAILGTIAKQERLRLSERVKAGLDRAKRTGTRSGNPIGRPRRVFDREKVHELRQAGASLPAIARQLGVGLGTVTRTLRAATTKGHDVQGVSPTEGLPGAAGALA